MSPIVTMLNGFYVNIAAHQERLHVGQHEADIERARAVDVANPAGAVDEKDAEVMIERARWIIRILLSLNGLTVGVEDRLELCLRRGRQKAPFGGGLVALRDLGISGHARWCVAYRIKR